MTGVTEYRAYAEECRKLAQSIGNDTARLLKLASMWDDLADEQDRSISRSYGPLWLQRATAWLSL